MRDRNERQKQESETRVMKQRRRSWWMSSFFFFLFCHSVLWVWSKWQLNPLIMVDVIIILFFAFINLNCAGWRSVSSSCQSLSSESDSNSNSNSNSNKSSGTSSSTVNSKVGSKVTYYKSTSKSLLPGQSHSNSHLSHFFLILLLTTHLWIQSSVNWNENENKKCDWGREFSDENIVKRV